jgi:hypothetical protein
VFYKKPGQPWVKVRKLEHGVHVLDVIEFQGKLYACGGGISNAEDYKKGVNQASLWRSDDGGDTWGIDTEWTSGNLTAVYRWEQFLRTGDDFYVFGSVVDSTTSTLTNIPRRFDGGKWTSVKLLPSTWVQRTEPFDAKSGLAWGPDLTGETAHFRAYRVEAGDKATPITFLEDRQERVMDFFHVADSDGLFLTRDGAAYPDKAAAPYRFHVYRTQDLAAFDELVTFDSEDTFLSLALWQGAVYLGTKEGFVYRTAPQ